MEKQELISDILKSKWTAIEQFVPLMGRYMYDKEIMEGHDADVILKVMLECLSVLFGELNNELGTLNKYKPKHYTDSDFVDMVIESISQKIPDKKEQAETLKYVEDFRIVLWGHTNYHVDKYLKLYSDILDAKRTITHGDIGDLKECLTIVMIECLLRIKERTVEES